MNNVICNNENICKELITTIGAGLVSWAGPSHIKRWVGLASKTRVGFINCVNCLSQIAILSASMQLACCQTNY